MHATPVHYLSFVFLAVQIHAKPGLLTEWQRLYYSTIKARVINMPTKFVNATLQKTLLTVQTVSWPVTRAFQCTMQRLAVMDAVAHKFHSVNCSIPFHSGPFREQ